MRITKNRVVAITGASSGVGREAALAFAHKGAIVVLIARRKGALEHVAAQCRPTASAVLVRPADAADESAIESVASDVYRRFGGIDVWVNAASVNMLSSSERYPDAEWRRRIERRLFDTYHGLRTVVPYFRAQGTGAIINVPSILSRPGEPFHEAFAAGKDAMRAVTHCLRREVVDIPGVTVSAVVPGPVEPAQPRPEDVDPYAPLEPVLDPWRGARAVVACAKTPRGELLVDPAPRTLAKLVGMTRDAFERLVHRRGERDRIIGTLDQTMEHHLVLPGRER
ncbi:SDR family NAD(P)-dependent oxidoreductase [Glycomyces xiaoerkulensis]|uniref:SDR family NAD(P)-dependent oxidoreductase n=1 Tax=Glycomyces xiaoerkulensis TaxID=2038139 RepID=UPI0012FFF99D|nr:SDR family NAD(P)-dependent oxidoreductase [Glycomyces xiaoerkulensis]